MRRVKRGDGGIDSKLMGCELEDLRKRKCVCVCVFQGQRERERGS